MLPEGEEPDLAPGLLGRFILKIGKFFVSLLFRCLITILTNHERGISALPVEV